MIVSQIILLIMEWIGTISFAVPGSFVAIRHGLDLFGVVTVGTITAVGGGVMRDIIIGNVPPKIFFNLLIFGIYSFVSGVNFIIHLKDGFSPAICLGMVTWSAISVVNGKRK